MEGDLHKREKMPDTHISIHSLRMEGDVPVAAAGGFGWLISIHSLRMEGDVLLCTQQHQH